MDSEDYVFSPEPSDEFYYFIGFIVGNFWVINMPQDGHLTAVDDIVSHYGLYELILKP